MVVMMVGWMELMKAVMMVALWVVMLVVMIALKMVVN